MQVIKQFETEILTWKPKREKPQRVLLLIYFTIIGQHQLTKMHPHPCFYQHPLVGGNNPLVFVSTN